MAAGNMLLGYARGSVGDVTFQRLKGQQITKARNRKPNNPKTEKQQLQRAKFSGAQLFHKQLVARFFKFAYEDKTERESDYNAFMRHNTGIAPLIFKQSTRNDEYPVFAPFQVSQGSLPSISLDLIAVGSNLSVRINDWAGVNMTEEQTIGELSSYLIDSNPNRWRQGDIITFLTYGALENAFTAPPSPEYAFECQQVIKQFIIDTSDTQLVSDLFSSVDGDTIFPGREYDEKLPFTTNDAIAITVIHSRNVSGGLQVSTQSLVLSDKAQEVYQSSNYYTASNAFIQEILTSWEAADLAILQGSLAKKASNTPFAVVEVIENNSAVRYAVTNGQITIPANILNAQGASLSITFASPKFLPVNQITFIPNVAGANILLISPSSENNFESEELITIEGATWQTGTYTIRFSDVGNVILNVI